MSYAKAVYSVFLLVFLESHLDFPEEWYLQPLFFLVRSSGSGPRRFGRPARVPDVHEKTATPGGITWSHRYTRPRRGGRRRQGGLPRDSRVIELHEAVVAIEESMDSPLLDEVYDLGVPVIHGNGRSEKVLKQAGRGRGPLGHHHDQRRPHEPRRRLTARDINPDAKIVVRLFDETLAKKISGAFLHARDLDRAGLGPGVRRRGDGPEGLPTAELAGGRSSWRT